MALFKLGSSGVTNAYIPIVTKMIHYDKEREFLWDDYIDILIQSGIQALQEKQSNIDRVSAYWKNDLQTIPALLKEVALCGRKVDGVNLGTRRLLVSLRNSTYL